MVLLVAWMQRSKCKITWAKANLQMSNVTEATHNSLPSRNHWSTVPYDTANPSAIGRCSSQSISLWQRRTDRLAKGLHLSLYVSLSKHQSILHQPICSSIRPESLWLILLRRLYGWGPPHIWGLGPCQSMEDQVSRDENGEITNKPQW